MADWDADSPRLRQNLVGVLRDVRDRAMLARMDRLCATISVTTAAVAVVFSMPAALFILVTRSVSR